MKTFSVALLSLFLVSSFMINDEQTRTGLQADPEHSISEIMKIAHGKDSLLNKVAGGDASEEEMKKLLALYVDLLDNDPAKGERADWEAATTKIIVAMNRVMLGQEDAGKGLKQATNCKACHDKHK
ncbi:MAG: hypothetical protein KF851_13955 [Pirellulaceae bacterium]|nr:hypothetical protein [Pirellulaceae bacterium]